MWAKRRIKVMLGQCQCQWLWRVRVSSVCSNTCESNVGQWRGLWGSRSCFRTCNTNKCSFRPTISQPNEQCLCHGKVKLFLCCCLFFFLFFCCCCCCLLVLFDSFCLFCCCCCCCFIYLFYFFFIFFLFFFFSINTAPLQAEHGPSVQAQPHIQPYIAFTWNTFFWNLNLISSHIAKRLDTFD